MRQISFITNGTEVSIRVRIITHTGLEGKSLQLRNLREKELQHVMKASDVLRDNEEI
jgi:hypothetical protein